MGDRPDLDSSQGFAMRAQRQWGWAGALSRGTSHMKANEPRQDAASVAEHPTTNGTVFVAVVCDGAGSAQHSDVGARIAACKGQSLVRAFFRSGNSLANIDEQLCEGWISSIRTHLERVAGKLAIELQDLASTMTLAVVGNEEAIVLQVGDSACVMHDNERWIIPVWPMKGEYANHTFFLTRTPNPFWRMERVQKRICQIALFTDGIERLVLRENSRQIFEPFFDFVFKDLSRFNCGGRNRHISQDIKAFLSGDRVTSLTDDDKTLVIACRNRK